MSVYNAPESLKFIEEHRLLLAEISHDLRTALTRIRLATEILDHTNGYLVSLINQDIEICEALVGELIKKISGQFQQQTSHVDLNQVIETAVAAENRYEKRVETDLYPEHLWVTVHPFSIQRAVTNLITNAIHYGNGWVSIKSGRSKENVWFQVEDNGPGIVFDQTLALLQPFVRGMSAESLDPTGVGLGLSIVKRIVDHHRGQLQFCHKKGSESHRGMIVKVTLPV